MKEIEVKLGEEWHKVVGWRPRHPAPATNRQGVTYMPEDYILEGELEISPNNPNIETRLTGRDVKANKQEGVRKEYRYTPK